MKLKLLPVALWALCVPMAALAETTFVAEKTVVTDWKAVYGSVEAKDTIPARARLGGTLVELNVSEGDQVQSGQVLGQIVDEKIAFQLGAIDAQLESLAAQLTNAEAELARAAALLDRGVTTKQRLDALQTQVDVVMGQIEAQKAQRRVIEQQSAEGQVLAPISGRVLAVPVAKGAVVMAGESVATVGGGGFFLTLAVPERHAASLVEGDTITIETREGDREGTLAKVYPQIENGRVVADVDVPDLDAAFVNARVLVRLPMGEREAVEIPAAMIRSHSGLDFVLVQDGAGTFERAVVPGARRDLDGVEMVEVLSGLTGGETVVAHEQ